MTPSDEQDDATVKVDLDPDQLFAEMLPWQQRLAKGGDPLEGLHPDLVPYITKGAIGPMLAHPLVHEIMPIAELANRVYEYKRSEYAAAMAMGDLEKASFLIEKPSKLRWIVDMVETAGLDQERLAKLLAETWTLIELPLQNVPQRELVRLFRRAGFVSDSEAGPPTWPLTLYRGAPTIHRHGMSWTTDKEKADWFAQRWANTRGAGRTWVATVQPNRVLGVFDSRNEDEVVIDSRNLVITEVR
jgi:hypothetical protein